MIYIMFISVEVYEWRVMIYMLSGAASHLRLINKTT